MQLYTLLSRLPYTLVISSLALAASAVPVESVELTVLNPSNFKDSIAEGVWFIEHFSPYCGHCRNFAPTWKQLVEETESQEDPGIHLAQVNCAVDGDLCRDNQVTGYPQMNLYKNGEFVETFKKSREIEIVREFISSHAQKKTPPPPPPPPPPAAPAKVEQQIPIVREVYNPAGTVMKLTPRTFAQTLKKGHVFVKYFAPWCGHCKKLAPIWETLAAEMRGQVNIAEVDCEAHGALCRTQDVTGYPMLFYYGETGSSKTEYSGGRKLEQLRAFAEKVSGPAVQQIAPENIDKEVSAHPVVFLMLHPAQETASVKQVTEASHSLFGSPPVYVSSSHSLYDRFNLDSSKSAILALKDHDSSVPAAWSYLDRFGGSADKLGNWLVSNKLPTYVELDSDNFQEVMNAAHKPLVVLVAAPKAELASAGERARAVAQQWKDSKAAGAVVFTTMDADKWAKWLGSMYGIKPENGVSVVVANHSRLVYYDVDQFGEKIALSQKSISRVVEGVLQGTASYKHSENLVERLARFLNNRLVGIEHFVSNHPWGISFFVIAGIAVVVFFIRRIIAEEGALADDMARKARLD